MTRRTWLALGLTLAALLAGCKNGGSDQNSVEVRLLNAVVDAEPLDMLVDSDVAASAIAANNTSAYKQLTAGTRTVIARSSTNGATLMQKSMGLASGQDFTVVFFGKRASVQSMLLNDATTDPSSGKFKIRAAGLTADVGLLDLYLLSGDLASTAPTISSLTYGGITDYTEVTAGTYSFVLTTAGTKQVVFQSPSQQLSAGAKLSFFTLPAGGGGLANATLLNSSGGTFMANPLARVKAINAIPDSTALTFKADSSTLLSNVPYMGVSSYVTTASGTRALSAELSAVPGTALVSKSQALGAARDYTFIAGGMLVTASPFVLADDNSAPTAGFAKVRFGNARADGIATDVLVNFATRASNLVPGSASDYFLLASGTSYTITFTSPGGVTVLATFDTDALDSGGIYTAYLFGTATTPVAKLVRDR